MKERFCPECDDGIAMGKSVRCAACERERRRKAALARYHRLSDGINQRKRELGLQRGKPRSEAQRERHVMLLRAYARARNEAEIDQLLIAWGQAKRRRRAKARRCSAQEGA